MQKKWLLIPLLFCLMITSLSAQRQRGDNTRSSEREPNGFGQQLWYGGSFNLGFSGGNFSSVFQLGVSPLVGYKITEMFSVGPRIILDYSLVSARVSNGSKKNKSTFSYGAGLFARHKIFRQIFAHVEYEILNQAIPTLSFDDIVVLRRTQNNAYIGGGYNSGFPVGYEILILYNFNETDNNFGQVTNPISIRIGFTYNF